jgi:hypothetical protein
MEKVIFLDIDGVLATDKEFCTNRTKFRNKNETAKELNIPYPFNKKAVDVFNEILDATDADIVLSSDWRMHWDLDELDRIFKFNGVKKSPIAVTHKLKRKMSSDLEDDRLHQIVDFKRQHNLTNWVAIDDLDMSFGLGDHFFLTKSNDGIKRQNLKEKIIKKLNISSESNNELL